MQNYELLFGNKDKRTIGFIISRYWKDDIYIKMGQLWISNNTYMLRGGFYSAQYECYKSKTFFWGKFCDKIQFKDIKNIRIEEVQEIPEWVNKTQDDVLLEIKDYKQKLWEKGLLGRFFNLFSTK